MLKISKDIIDKIIHHAVAEFPIEACGYLAEKNGLVCHHFAMTNTDKSAVHFSMDPAEQFAVVRECRKRGLTIKAVYHSHPNTPPRPSPEDIRLACDPSLSYVIISLADAEPRVRSFVIKKGTVEPEPLEITLKNKKEHP